MNKVLRVLAGLGLAAAAFGGFSATSTTVHAASGTLVPMQYLGQVSLQQLRTPPSTNYGTSKTDAHPIADNPNIKQGYPQGQFHSAAFPPVPSPTTSPVTTSNGGWMGFNGLSHYDQRNAGTGQYVNTQWSLEPPDQALCVGNGFLIEGVNTAFAVYGATANNMGQMLSGPTAYSQFFGFVPEHNRVTGFNGQFVSDPRCMFDPQIQRFFMVVLVEGYQPIDQNGNVGTYEYVAISNAATPFGGWKVFALNTTNNGDASTPTHPNCPCLGDQPLMGSDANALYITTNEFGQISGFNGAQVYAISKQQLAAGTNPKAYLFATISIPDLAGNPQVSYSIQPANAPTANSMPQNEYFLSALQFGTEGSVTDNRIVEWNVLGAASLNTTTPNLSLQYHIITTEPYGQPVPAQQVKDGPRPLGNGAALVPLNTNDDRMNQVVFADNLLWSGVNTLLTQPDGSTHAGIAYFVVNPNGGGTPTIANQGYISVAGHDVMFPAIGANPSGGAFMSFSIVGPNYFPSTAYAKIFTSGGNGPVHVAGMGAAPEDGFTCYSQGVCRWGDYSAAVADSTGLIWMASEYIPNAPRTASANWGTFVSRVSPFGNAQHPLTGAPSAPASPRGRTIWCVPSSFCPARRQIRSLRPLARPLPARRRSRRSAGPRYPLFHHDRTGAAVALDRPPRYLERLDPLPSLTSLAVPLPARSVPGPPSPRRITAPT